VPNLGTESELALRDALHWHPPSVAYTLVSLGALDQEGYHANIGAGRLGLVSPKRERVGQIPRTPRRLYKVKHSPESADATELLSVMELHRRMGISRDRPRPVVRGARLRRLHIRAHNSFARPKDTHRSASTDFR